MTEYEVADLAFSKIMQIQGVGALFQGHLDSSGALIQQFICPMAVLDDIASHGEELFGKGNA